MVLSLCYNECQRSVKAERKDEKKDVKKDDKTVIEVDDDSDVAVHELDSLNRNPSMAALLAIIDHMNREFGSRWTSVDMPEWMKALHTKIGAGDTHVNVKWCVSGKLLSLVALSHVGTCVQVHRQSCGEPMVCVWTVGPGVVWPFGVTCHSAFREERRNRLPLLFARHLLSVPELGRLLSGSHCH
jgi:hypothetical protein